MTEEEIKALKDAKEAAERRAAEAEAQAQAARTEADTTKVSLNNLVEELKTERQKKNEALAKAQINNGETDVSVLIEQALQTKEAERRKAELEQAIAEFKVSKPEFQADSAGLVFGKFQEQLGKFNLSDVQSKDQAKSRLEEIYRFVNFKQGTDSTTDYEGTTQGVHTVPDNGSQMPATTEATIKAAGVTPEKFKDLKAKYPDALNSLGIN
jgi:hypothetical protein